MLSDKRSLFDFLIDGRPGGGSDVRGHFAALEPFFRKAEAGEYDLVPADELRHDEAAEAISVASGADVSRIACVSLSHGASPLIGRARADFWEAHARDLSIDLKLALWRQHECILGTAISAERRQRLERVIWHAVGEPLWHSFEQNRWDETGTDLRLVIRANVLAAFLHYAGFVLLGNERRVESLLPLLRLMSRTLPLGERADEPGTWTCITA
ncbi:MAG TPA: hypothetical protein VLC10_04680 [Patescibacteria group bacterium]|nr:hypothetical protein [Patescibacteria group bacterium]